MSTTRRRRGRLDLQLESEIRRLAEEGHSAAQIAAFLGDKAPDIRSIRWRVKLYGPPPDTAASWSLADADPEDAALVLPVLAEAIERGRGHWQRFSKDLAGWIVRVRVAAPDIPPLWALQVAQAYWAHERQGRPTGGLDQMLAFAPWRPGKVLRYYRAMKTAHPGWFDFIEDRWASHPMINLSRGTAWDPDAAGLMVAVDCVEREAPG